MKRLLSIGEFRTTVQSEKLRKIVEDAYEENIFIKIWYDKQEKVEE